MKIKNIFIGVILVILVILVIFSIYFFIDKLIVGSANNNNETVEKYKNPYIPEEFKKVETEYASWEEDINGNIKGWNDGLVIEDSKGNQFVWVPCVTNENKKNITLFSLYKQETKEKLVAVEKLVAKNNLDGSNIYFEEDYENISKIKDSVEKYNGFYVGRYETGIEGGNFIDSNDSIPYKNEKFKKWENGTAVIKQDSNIWNYVNFLDAKNIAETFIKSDNIKTSLINGYCYDTIIKWISADNTNVIEDIDGKYGNYLDLNINDGIAKSGSSDNYKLKNIYDILGNTIEWTEESMYESDYYYYVLRGGQKGEFYEGESFSRSNNISGKISAYGVGFRIILYIN